MVIVHFACNVVVKRLYCGHIKRLFEFKSCHHTWGLLELFNQKGKLNNLLTSLSVKYTFHVVKTVSVLNKSGFKAIGTYFFPSKK
jgi:hypothetical protein